ncbi:MAG: hypothetical protein CSB49_00255 [Proteobacteria bacterium]|nr:MAG: hypothetical protein CSB49_00255 [Pseudomonadota bacterium]
MTQAADRAADGEGKTNREAKGKERNRAHQNSQDLAKRRGIRPYDRLIRRLIAARRFETPAFEVL